MMFYRDSTSSGGTSVPNRTPRPLQGPIGDDEARHLTWMLKSFVMGITLLGLSYWLVQIAGVQYLATLTSATILSFLLLYIVLCITQRTRRHIQRGGATEQAESERRVSTTSNARSEPQTPIPEHGFDEYTPYKNILRGCSPPPSYEEAMRAMGIDLETLHALQYSPHPPDTSSYPPQQVPDYIDQMVVAVVPVASPSSSQDISISEASVSTQQPPHYHEQTVITIVPSTSSTLTQGVPAAEDSKTLIQNSSTTSTSQVIASSPLPAVVDNQYGTGVS